MFLQTQRKGLILALLLLVIEKSAGSLERTEERTLSLTGKYSWELLFDIDNTNNSGHIIRKEEYKVSLFISYDQLLSQVNEYAHKAHVGFESGAKLEVVSVSMSSGFESSVSQKYESTTKNHEEKREELTKTSEFDVGPNSKLVLYRLVFNGPGISYVTDTLSSTPRNISDVIISCTVKAKNFLKNIKVVYTGEGDAASKPSNSLVEVDGWNADINGGFDGDHVWLVPVWTTNPAIAATSIEVIIQRRENNRYSNLARGAGGPYRYLKMITDSVSNERITNLKLWRSKDKTSKPSLEGWKGWTGDINADRGGDYLYICWKTMQI
uniref:Uncharacterized protein n=1 Tax=Strigamia maritima TaxID=126957 RepID=T1IT88_STRMM